MLTKCRRIFKERSYPSLAVSIPILQVYVDFAAFENLLFQGQGLAEERVVAGGGAAEPERREARQRRERREELVAAESRAGEVELKVDTSQ